ncbi:MAG: recombination protein RecR [Erysipelotrichaceae bacterium]|nr:recombination protein RecR [Erysipelotrichaceae bacterium]
MYPNSIEKLIECFRKLPSVGRKTAERYAMALVEMNKDEAREFAQAVLEVTDKIKYCSICGHLTEKELCSICEDENRDHNTICVVQNPKDVLAIERIGLYKGVYHVLHGAISTTRGILPEDINIESLLKRINDDTKEIILATNSTIEGDTTALYLSKILKNYPHVFVTRLASGLPTGGNLDYVDDVTLIRALQGRIKQ